MEEEKDVETKAIRQLAEILLRIIIIVLQFGFSFILYNAVIVPVFGAPPVTAQQAIWIWLFIKMVFVFK